MQLKELALSALHALDAAEDLWSGRAEKLDLLVDRIDEEEERLFEEEGRGLETQPMPMPNSLRQVLLALIPLSLMTAIAAFRRSRAAR